MVDLVAPIGKGQRGLIVSPPGAGRTTLLQDLAQAFVANDPQATLIVLLVDERPEEVTAIERALPGAEVVATTFDDPPERQVHVADLVLEKAKRLVEAGQDVVILMDSITQLARAHNAASETRTPGVLDAAAVRGPKKLFGAARAVEEGGSLTVIATILSETGSALDAAVLEEFSGTGNMTLVLRRDLAAAGLFPAVDVLASRTRREEILVAPERLLRVRSAPRHARGPAAGRRARVAAGPDPRDRQQRRAPGAGRVSGSGKRFGCAPRLSRSSSALFMPRIETVLLDMDGVLVDVHGSFRRAVAETVADFTGAPPPDGRAQALKDGGGYNNDWVLSHRLIEEAGVTVDV